MYSSDTGLHHSPIEKFPAAVIVTYLPSIFPTLNPERVNPQTDHPISNPERVNPLTDRREKVMVLPDDLLRGDHISQGPS